MWASTVVTIPLPPEISALILSGLVLVIPLMFQILRVWMELTLSRIESKLDGNTRLTQNVMQRVTQVETSARAGEATAHDERFAIAAKADEAKR